ncbi:MAG: peptide ABC transporter substrate-binding protein [Chloroflexi bacterium]|nr:peptide ABC transporter substrate-binding protein [Chloroflexota bacterium]
MSRTPTWLPLIAMFAVTAIVFSACAGAASPSPGSASPSAASGSPSAVASASASASAASSAPFDATSYPETAIDCANPPQFEGRAYTGNISQIVAADQYTVEFHLCQPDVAFLSKIAFASNNIQDADWLQAHAKDKSYVRDANGTGAYQLKEWIAGDHLTLEAYPTYWGEAAKSPTAIIRWSKEATQRLQELAIGTVDGIDNVGTDDFQAVKDNPELALFDRVGLNVFYMGFNVDQAPWNDEKVRQAIAKGIDRQRIVDTFFPAGSEASKYFTPCDIPGGCGGDAWYEFDAAAAKQELTAAGFDFAQTYKMHYRTKTRSYLPNPPAVAQDIQAQFKDNLGIDVEIVVEEDATYLTNSSKGDFPLFLLGWGADYPDVTNFLDYHFGTGANDAFGPHFPDVEALLKQGSAEQDPAKRGEIYAEANGLIRQHVPMVPIAHVGSATAFRADVDGAHSSPIGNEQLAVMTPGDRNQLVWMQQSEPSGLYCGDESDGDALRACEQIFESLYGYELGGVEVKPVLAESCDPSADLKVWTCTLKQGVTFHKGGELDANDVVLSYAIQWDAKHELHVGNGGAFDYFPALFGGFLNPPAPA